MFGFDPMTWLLARLGASLGLGFAVLVILLFVFGGRIFGFFRRRFLASRAAARRAARKPGQLLCAECAAVLGGHQQGSLCPECRGVWIKEADLTALLARKGKPPREWCAETGLLVAVCPECGAELAAGRFVGEDFAVYRCAPCAGLWLGGTEAVSFQLRILS